MNGRIQNAISRHVSRKSLEIEGECRTTGDRNPAINYLKFAIKESFQSGFGKAKKVRLIRAIVLNERRVNKHPSAILQNTIHLVDHHAGITHVLHGSYTDTGVEGVTGKWQMMGVTETVASTVDDYVSIAARLAIAPEERQRLSRRIAENKQRVYRDRACITALEDFLDGVARQPGKASIAGCPSMGSDRELNRLSDR